MIGLLAWLFIIVCGVWYAVNPLSSLKHKFGKDGVPKESIKAARISGVLVAVVGLFGAIHSLLELLGA